MHTPAAWNLLFAEKLGGLGTERAASGEGGCQQTEAGHGEDDSGEDEWVGCGGVVDDASEELACG